MFIGSRSGNITTEKISWQSTLIGALALVGAQIALRLAAIVPVIAWILLTGRWAGPLLIFTSWTIAARVRVRSLFPFRATVSTRSLKRYEARKALILFVGGLLLLGLSITAYWPAIGWEIGAGRLWLSHPWGSLGLSPIWLWLRLALIAGMPWALLRPGMNLDWVLDIETRWPKAREVGFGQADIESPAVRRASQPRLKRLPQRTGDGPAAPLVSIQTPNAPDSDLVMKVDGV